MHSAPVPVKSHTWLITRSVSAASLCTHFRPGPLMHFSALIAIGWLYVTILMSLSQPTVLAGLSTLLFYGLLPLAIVLYIVTTPARRRRRRERESGREEPAASRQGPAS